MSTETNELNRLFNNISGGTVDLKLSQTKWLQMINEWIEENGIGGGGSSYKGITVLETGTHINDGSELPTTYEFGIYTDGSSIEEYWGDGEKLCLLIHHLNSDEIVLTPVALLSSEGESGPEYGIQLPSRNIWFSSAEKYDDMIIAYCKNESKFNQLEAGLKEGNIIPSGSGDAITDEPIKLIMGYGMTSSGIPGGNSSSSHFRLTIAIPPSIMESQDENKLKSYLEGNKLCFWIDAENGNTYLTPFNFYTDPIEIEFIGGDYLSVDNSGVGPDGAYFDFDASAKELFVQNSLNGSGGGSSSGPNYQMPITDSGDYGSGWYAEILAATSPRIIIRNLEVDENYMLLRLTYQRVVEDESPIETKVFSIIHLEGQGTDDPTQKIYYIIWNIEQNYTIYETTEGDPQPTSSYLEFYPTIIGFNPQYKE